MFFRSYRAFRYYGSIFCGNSVLSHFIIRLCSVVPMELNAKMRMEKKTGNLGCFVCPLPVFFSLNYQPFLATLPPKKTIGYHQLIKIIQIIFIYYTHFSRINTNIIESSLPSFHSQSKSNIHILLVDRSIITGCVSTISRIKICSSAPYNHCVIIINIIDRINKG